jgi:hypothetical protein
MKPKNKNLLICFLLVIPSILIALVLSIFIFQERLAETLAKTKNTKADIMVFEAWVSESLVPIASDEFITEDYKLIVVTGIESGELDFCQIPMNGYLIFYPATGLMNDEEIRNHNIDITVHSEMGGKYSCHFNFFVNDTLLSEFVADDKERKYSVIWNGALKDIDSLMVHFDDDYLDEGGDKNLYVKEITINNDIIIPYKYNSVYDIGRIGGTNRFINNYNSESELSKIHLINTGIDPSLVIAVTGKSSRINRTLKSALAFRKWLGNYNSNVKSINIISDGIHSRRTMITYNSILKSNIEIGIISLSEPAKEGNPKHKFKEILSETLKLIYYCIILIPYSISK